MFEMINVKDHFFRRESEEEIFEGARNLSVEL
jgi:hypothetical protein